MVGCSVVGSKLHNFALSRWILKQLSIYIMSRSTRLLFSGKKSFWKSRKVISIDILLIQHCPAQIIEVIACDAELKFEAPHLYVVEDVLLQKLDSSQLGPDRAIVDFIFDRIVVSSYAPEHDSFEVDITNTIGEATLEGLVVARPRGLVPYTSPFAHSCRYEFPGIKFLNVHSNCIICVTVL